MVSVSWQISEEWQFCVFRKLYWSVNYDCLYFVTEHMAAWTDVNIVKNNFKMSYRDVLFKQMRKAFHFMFKYILRVKLMVVLQWKQQVSHWQFSDLITLPCGRLNPLGSALIEDLLVRSTQNHYGTVDLIVSWQTLSVIKLHNLYQYLKFYSQFAS